MLRTMGLQPEVERILDPCVGRTRGAPPLARHAERRLLAPGVYATTTRSPNERAAALDPEVPKRPY